MSIGAASSKLVLQITMADNSLLARIPLAVRAPDGKMLAVGGYGDRDANTDVAIWKIAD